MKNVNADFLLDIWADLKAKRLAPVAVALAVAVVAMPALLLKGEEAPSAGPLPIVAASASNDGGAEVELAEELADGSKLDSYKAHDPFDGLVKPDDGTAGTSGTAIAPGDAGAAAAADDLANALGGGSTGAGPPASSPGFGQPPSGLSTPGSNPSPVVRRPSAKYTYELDVKFGRPGREKRYPHLSRMSFLPSPKIPALLFLGVPVDEKSAIFLVHPGLDHQGEGVCLPNPTNCNFLELKIGRDHFLAVNDYEFRIHLLGIKRVKIDADATEARKTSGVNRSGRGGDEGASGSKSDAGEFEPPTIVDGIG
jgi:hypothetical protein